MSVKPLEDRVLIKPLEPETKTASGIYLPESAKEKPMQGKVVAVGPGKLLDNGERITPSVRKGDTVVRLTDREREMLQVLAATPGETVPRMALAGSGGAVSERAVDVQVNRLRRKIERDPANPLLVQTVRGIGYRLVTTP